MQVLSEGFAGVFDWKMSPATWSLHLIVEAPP